MYQSKLLNQAIVNTTVSKTKNSNSISVSPLSVNPDEEPIIEIDADSRTITIPNELRDIAVTGDHLSETIYFSCPRYFDGEDLSLHTCIIRFINAGNEYGEANAISLESSEDRITFGWAIDNYATRYSGTLTFTVQFETRKDNIDYQWQTTPAHLNILPGLNIESTITDQDDILFRTLSNQISILQKKVEALERISSNISDLQNTITTLQSEVDYLKENVVYTLST